ncbi:ORF6N domain-containing protein [Photorhabdus temperata]|uniref:ORF6N domain-containing protein n=3 Tax=Photorhabdus temperata TaxID=574560 RepID=A0A081RS54_PHOTE|nr:ORF6N domain-containing protein [Photorhabdus temperata]KER01507.1 ORF6N domain-containing protein [Photorhabdus temperata subsp. temperata Meg1]
MTNQISAQNLPSIHHNGIPVITTELLAELYTTDVVRIRQNHARNADRFSEGKHFFILKGKELQELKNRVSLSYSVESGIQLVGKRARSLTLWTERGAARHAKMLDTDKAWDVFEALEDFYFNQKDATPTTTLVKTTNGIQFPENGKILITMRNSTVDSCEIVRPDSHVLTLNTFMELAQKAGYLIIHRENLLNMENSWKY